MFYYVKITSKSGKETELNGLDDNGSKEKSIKEDLKRISIKIDMVGKVEKSRGGDVLNKVEIELAITSKTNKICKDFMEWALLTSGDDLYRKVNIEIVDDKNNPIRTFDLDEMFIEDCFEDYSGKDGNLKISLIQRANCQDLFKHDVV